MARRCLSCGRRWLGAAPLCGHPQDTPPDGAQEPISGVAPGQEPGAQPGPAEPIPEVALPGYRIGEILGRG
ncbi:MAG TPA: hypothetical protein VNM90_07770, partial [Haliangium sp.]|nr:hypothetical protein [Haliangium sp.]